MQDWVLVLGPIVAVVYFLAHPSEFTTLMDWFARLMH